MEYPVGHARRREEGIPLLLAKFRTNLARMFPEAQQQRILNAARDRKTLESMSVSDFMDLFVI